MNTAIHILDILVGASVIAIPYFKVLRTHKNVLKIAEDVEAILKNVSEGAKNS